MKEQRETKHEYGQEKVNAVNSQYRQKMRQIMNTNHPAVKKIINQ